MSQIVAASTSAGFTLPAGSSLNVSGSGIVHITPPGQNLREIVLNGAAQMVGPYRFDAYIGLNAPATAALSYDVTIGYGTVGDPVTVPSISQAGLTVTATLAIGWIATGGWQWKRVAPNGTITDISGATSASYTQQAADLVAGTRIYPQPIGLTFAPYGITADGTVIVVPTPGTISLSASTYSVGEAAGSVTVLVQRSGGSSGAASVQVATSSGSATSGADFTAVSLTLTWADGDAATKNVVIPIINDTVVEGNETFNVTLSAATGAALGSPAAAVVTIVDDDFAATISGTAPPGTVGVPYSFNFTTTGFVGTITPSLTSGTLPAGLALSVSGSNIVLSGTPTAALTSAFLVHGVGATSGTADSASQSVVIAAPAADTKPRVTTGATGTSLATLFAAATDIAGGTNGSRVAGPFTVAAPSGQYGVVFILASACVVISSGVYGATFTSSLGTGDWNGVMGSGPNTGASPTPSRTSTTYTDSTGVYAVFRADYPNTTFTGSIS